jgi:DNA-binding CsgD family transcriptional regulator
VNPLPADRIDLSGKKRSYRKPIKRIPDAGRLSNLPRLTARERAVLARVAQGETNRQIATVLKASPRTIEKHIEHILAKLERSTARLPL